MKPFGISAQVKYATRGNNCKARSSAARKESGRTLGKTKDEQEHLAKTAAAYLELWVEHWASCLAAPETASTLTKLWAPFAGANFDRSAGPSDPRSQPSPLRTAPSAGNGRLDELESRIGVLERRLAALERPKQSAMARVPRKPRSRNKKVRSGGPVRRA